MHNNPFVLVKYADDLNQKLRESTCLQCFSTSTTALFILFNNAVCIHIQFLKERTLFMMADVEHLPTKNILPQFKEIANKRLLSISCNFPDRGIRFYFAGNMTLHVLAYGRYSGVLLVKQKDVTDGFKLPNWQTANLNVASPILFGLEKAAFAAAHRFMNPELLQALCETDFFDASVEVQSKIWAQFKKDMLGRPLLISEGWDIKRVSLFSSGTTEVEIKSSIEALDRFGKSSLASERFDLLYKSCQSALSGQMKHLTKTRNNAEIRLQKLGRGSENKEIADVLMANLHAIEKGAELVELMNFYTHSKVVIKLKPKETAQKNAERYYKKAKNAHLEVQHVEKLIKEFNVKLNLIENQLSDLERINDYKSLVKFHKGLGIPTKEKSINLSTPYKQFEKEGFVIWVGKSAKSNDDLLKLAGKNDTWLHAREVAGSHVLIRNQEQKPIPAQVLEYAAALAAGHSKNQHEGLAAVIYTSVKYVRKFKGAHEGQVRVEREEVLLIEPRKS